MLTEIVEETKNYEENKDNIQYYKDDIKDIMNPDKSKKSDKNDRRKFK